MKVTEVEFQIKGKDIFSNANEVTGASPGRGAAIKKASVLFFQASEILSLNQALPSSDAYHGIHQHISSRNEIVDNNKSLKLYYYIYL